MVHTESALEPLPVESALIEAAAAAALEHQAVAGDLTVVLTDDAQIQRLNRDYLGLDAPTDVLAFPAAEIDPENDRTYLGDVLISIPQAASQAQSAEHSLAAEVQLLVVHGILHLLGHDHADAEAKARMWAAQAAILRRIGLAEIEIRET
jgi:probable rRNA maturation factor